MADSEVSSEDKSVLMRGLAILECFTTSDAEQTIQSIAGQTGLPPSTVHRLVRLLVEWGAIEKVARGRYRLGVRLWRLGVLVPATRALCDVAMPFMEDLYEITHGVVHLAIPDGVDALYVEKIAGRRTVSTTSGVGRRLPMYAAGPGKVLVAFSGPELLDRVLASGLEPITPRTITKESDFRRALAEIRKVGYAVSREEMSIGTASVAAPVFDEQGKVSASVAVVMPVDQLDAPHLGPLVRKVGQAISRSLARSSLR
jgi:DNA-binding IclR family transcriptional regulator